MESDLKREIDSLRNKVRYAGLRIAGLCPSCKGRISGDSAYCDECSGRSREKRREVESGREAVGLCVRCGDKAVSGHKYCGACIEKYTIVNDYERSTESGRDSAIERSKRSRDKARDDAINAYGGHRCTCCGEANSRFLTIDHIDGNGNMHRKDNGISGGGFYFGLRRNGYPKGFQVLCYNCNIGRYLNGGVCPHAELRDGEISSKEAKKEVVS